jgi:S-DNA-T family DNA segregation ATPase FtsK/SpoIIIE
MSTLNQQEIEARRFAEGRLHTLVAVLRSHDIVSMAVQAKLLPRKLTLLVSLSHGYSIEKLRGRSRDIAMALDVPHVEVGHEAGHAAVTIPLPAAYWRQPDFARMWFQVQVAEGRQSRSDLQVLLGLDDNGRVLTLDLASAKTPHLLIAGTTGAGKTNLLRSVLASLVLLNAPSQVQIVLVDVKRYEFTGFNGVQHMLFPVVTDKTSWPAAVGQVITRMRERRQQGPARELMPRFLLVIDEVATVLEEYHGLEASLRELTATGRAEGCHAVLATQKPTAKALSTLISSNLPARIAGACVSATDALIITGRAQSGAEKLPGHGAFLLVTEGGKVRQFTAPLVEEQDLDRLLAEVRARVHHPAELHSGKVVDFVAALSRKRQAGRPAKGVAPEVVEWLVAELEAGRRPSQRAIQRYIAQADGSGAELANQHRAEEALRLARAQVA